MTVNLTLQRRGLLLIPLVLSGFTHLWNPAGFPDIFFDEGVYMRRAMHVIEGLGPQESYFHDHPFFGQLFLAGALILTGFPGSSGTDADSISALYAVPRVLMGLLAIADTFLVFKITERKYGRNIALLASVLFAVMPITWLLRRILLDSILLPLVLSSIFFAMQSSTGKRRIVFVLLSGAFFGLAIFTKIPAVIMMPVVGYLVLSSKDSKLARLGRLGLWFIPLVGIPLIWPAQAVAAGQFDLWLRDVSWQAGRTGDFIGSMLTPFYNMDPVMLSLGLAGLGYAAYRRDYFLLIWAVPFLLFYSAEGYRQYFYWISVLPAFSVAASVFLVKAWGHVANKVHKRLLPVSLIAIAVFGLANTSILISTDLASVQYKVAAYVISNTDQNTTILASPVYSWIFSSVYDKNAFIDYRDYLFYPVQTDNVLLVADRHFMWDQEGQQKLYDLYDRTENIETFRGNILDYDSRIYPYRNLYYNDEATVIEVRFGPAS